MQYAILVSFKILGIIKLDWLTVALGILWIPLLLLIIGAVLALVVILAARIKRELRMRKVARRIIRQAKATGVWDNPNALGGKALELKAKEYKIKREPGETDAELRRRIRGAMAYIKLMNEADNDLANSPNR
jgi:uncharacterized protein (DUF58 family)